MSAKTVLCYDSHAQTTEKQTNNPWFAGSELFLFKPGGSNLSSIEVLLLAELAELSCRRNMFCHAALKTRIIQL